MNKAQSILSSPFKFKLFLLAKLPMGFIAGLRVEEISEAKSVISVPFTYLTKNPFRSIYFACLSMAGELASGALGLIQVYESTPAVSMLVVNMNASFSKKAVGKIRFICEDGLRIKEAIAETKRTGEGVEVSAKSIGFDIKGDQVAVFDIVWSFKAKK